MDGGHQHTDLRGIRLPLELCGEASLGNLLHLVPHRDNGTQNVPADHPHTERLENPHHKEGRYHQNADNGGRQAQGLDFFQGAVVQVLQKLLLQAVDLRDRSVVFRAVHIIQRSVLPSILGLLHGLFLQGDQLVGKAVHTVDHSLFLAGNADFLHGGHALIPVFQVVDLVPVVVIVFLMACGGESPDLVGQIGGAVHEAVGVISQGEPLFVGYIELSADFAVGQQGIYHEKQCKDGDSVQNQGQCGLLHCSFHIRVPPESLICSVYTKFGNNSSHICKKM